MTLCCFISSALSPGMQQSPVEFLSWDCPLLAFPPSDRAGQGVKGMEEGNHPHYSFSGEFFELPRSRLEKLFW